MNVNQLEYIISIEKEKSLSKAAKKKFISQSALSQHLVKLEKEMRTSLFERQRNEWVPTQAGAIYLKAAKSIVDTYEQMLKDISELSFNQYNTIRIGMSSERASLIMPHIYTRFSESFPDISVIILEEHQYQLQKMVISGDVDIAFCVVPSAKQAEEQKYLSWIPIATERLELITSKHHPLANQLKANPGQVIHLNELCDQPFICHKKPKAIRDLVDQVLQDNGIVVKELFEVFSNQLALEFVANDIGISFVPNMFVKCYPDIQIVEYQPPITWDLGVLYRRIEPLTAPKEFFAKLLREIMSDYNCSDL